MGMLETTKAALFCAYVLRKEEYKPATILNVGVGTSHEYAVWEWLFPDTEKIGVDPRMNHKMWKGAYIRAAIGKRMSRAAYCYDHRSTSCGCIEKPMGRPLAEVPQITVDKALEHFPSPYFMWMDCEGSEFNALKGAGLALPHTKFICIEIRNHPYMPQHAPRLFGKLKQCGYKLYSQIDGENHLYWREDSE